MAKDRHSRDQKRKKKLEERKRKARPTESLAYMGEPPEDELLTLGRQWILDEHGQAAVEFRELVDYLLEKGAADRVLNCCHQLIGEESDPSSEVTAELTALCLQARTSLVTSMG